MTGSLVNEKEKQKILHLLYKNRKSGMPIILNLYWKSNIQYSTQIRITLQYLSSDKKYIWCEHHRDIGNTYAGIKQTLDNVTVRAKITEAGIDYYRKEYRDDNWKYYGLRFGVLAIIAPFIWWLINVTGLLKVIISWPM